MGSWIMNYGVLFLSVAIRVSIVMVIGVALRFTVWDDLNLIAFGIGATVPAAIFAYRDSKE